MTSIVCNVKDIQESGRRWLEQTLGERLQDDQQVQIQVVETASISNDVGRRKALAELEKLAAKASEYARQQGITEEEIDAAVDEACDFIRHGRKP